MADQPVAQALERLLIVVRETPRAEAVHAALAAAAASAAAGLAAPEHVDAGVEGSAIPVGTTLRGRMLARAVDWIELRPGVTADALLALAQALASDALPLPEAPGTVITMVPLPQFEPAVYVAEADSSLPGEVTESAATGDATLDMLTEQLRAAAVQRDWSDAITRAEQLLDYAEMDPALRRSRLIQARRALPLSRLREMTEHALRHPEDQLATAELLARIGPDGHQVMVEAVAASDSLAARRFLHEQLGRTPEAFPLLLPLVERGTASQARHAAAILGRLGDARAVPALAAALGSIDESVRTEVLRALVRFDDPAARAALLDGLKHSSPGTRIAAAHAVGNAGVLALAPSLMAVLRDESDSSVRRAFVTAAARLGTVEAIEELVRMALTRRRVLHGGYPLDFRLDIVAGMAAAATAASRRALDRIAREADRPVQRAADQALNVRRG